MTTTLFDTGLPAENDEIGILSGRSLVAVQTFDIARLTTHPVPLVPGTFVAVSGRGPKGDSNGSGKTSFLAAVSLLLGEAQWRLDANGSSNAPKLLFKPESAGLDPRQGYSPTERGYIIGLFADDEHPADLPITVWMRISATQPHVRVRWTYGMHVVLGDGIERDELADVRWNELPTASELGARGFAKALYGEAPRCMAYLDTPMRPSAPSLLSQQITELDPEHIGEALIELTGRQALLESDLDQRRKVAAHHIDLAEREEEDLRSRQSEAGELEAVGNRDRARESLADGELLWRAHFAKGFIEKSTTDAEYAEIIDELTESAALLQQDRAAATTQVIALRARTDLQARELEAQRAFGNANTAYQETVARRAVLSSRMSDLESRRAELLVEAEGWAGTTVAQAEQLTMDASSSVSRKTADVELAKTRCDDLRYALDEVIEGRGGEAAAALDALSAAGIQAVLLLDEITLDRKARAAWEPRLWPHRGTVVVDPADESTALRALAVHPGATLLVAERTSSGRPRELSPGVFSTILIGWFLDTLLDRDRYEPAPDRVTDVDTTAAVLGGFPDEITGRGSRIAAARTALNVATAAFRDLERELRVLEHGLKVAQTELVAARAAAELDSIRTAISSLAEESAECDELLLERREQMENAQAVWKEATNAASGHQQLIELAEAKVKALSSAIDRVEEKLAERRRQRANLNLPYWVGGWANTLQAALDYVDEQAERIRDGSAKNLRQRAADRLKDALNSYRAATVDLPPELQHAWKQREKLMEGEPGVAGDDVDFTTIARPLRERLDTHLERDRIMEKRILRSQADRAAVIDQVRADTAVNETVLANLQDAISGHIDGSLRRISTALNRLNLARGGFGADLRIDETRPSTPMGRWRWAVTPRWKRSQSGAMVSYRVNANSAQVKVFAIQLVLAALLAAEGASGRVLILDELGNSLGDVNRKDVLKDLHEVAAEQKVTILGTCQDSVIADAVGVCGEILWFCHSSAQDPYNLPTRVWGYDPLGERVELTKEWLTSGRNLI